MEAARVHPISGCHMKSVTRIMSKNEPEKGRQAKERGLRQEEDGGEAWMRWRRAGPVWGRQSSLAWLSDGGPEHQPRCQGLCEPVQETELYPKDSEESRKGPELSYRIRSMFAKHHANCRVFSELKGTRLETGKSFETHLFTYPFYKDQKVWKRTTLVRMQRGRECISTWRP